MDDREARERVARVETLLEEIDSLRDPDAREKATEVVRALLDLYGEGLARIVTHVAERDDGELAGAFEADELVSHLLMLHGLHPVPLEARVRGALDDVRPYLESHGGDVELLSVEEGIARLRLEGSCSGCPSSTVTLKLAIEDAIYKAAPDVAGIEADDGAATPRLIQLEVAEPLRRSWERVDAIPQGGWLIKEVSGEPLLFLNVDGSHYAYRPSCPACEASLGDAVVSGAELLCSECGSRYDVVRAGRCLDAPELHLDPVPLLVEDGAIKVALGSLA
jgi:Fe-S cluster biogenesis protein NfuA/nitrite reductase/ring-hydroxylating ferredoxin subunit